MAQEAFVRRVACLSSAVVLCGAAASALAAEPYPLRIPAPGGEAIIPDAESQYHYDTFRFSAARRVGDVLYVSGVIVNRNKDEGNDAAAFRMQARRAFKRLQFILESSGSSFADVAMINSFHVWQGPNFKGTRDEQFGIFEEVIGEFIRPPYPAWTAVGTTGLLSDGGIVEVQLIARTRVPPASK
jgi:enamine deaminase RidA (YjgF/YER057c/UK114 family)